MNTYDLAYLKDTLHRLEFAENGSIMDQLTDAIENQPQEFEIDTEAFFDEETILSCTLYFCRSAEFDMYFLVKYDADLRYSNESEKNRAQTFYINKGIGVTQREAFNLLQGRSVNKKLINLDGEKYTAWIQLNFDQTLPSGNYSTRQFRTGYDLKKTLQQYPIRECQQEESMTGLIRSLQKGNLVLVDFVKQRKTEKMYIEANPYYRTINIYPVKSAPPRNSPQ